MTSQYIIIARVYHLDVKTVSFVHALFRLVSISISVVQLNGLNDTVSLTTWIVRIQPRNRFGDGVICRRTIGDQGDLV